MFGVFGWVMSGFCVGSGFCGIILEFNYSCDFFFWRFYDYCLI